MDSTLLFCPTSLNEDWPSTQRNRSYPSQKHYSHPCLQFPFSFMLMQRSIMMKSWVWSSAQTGSSTMSSQAELVQTKILPVLLCKWRLLKLPPASSFPVPYGSENDFLFTDSSPETLSTRTAPKWLFHPRMKVHTKHFFNFTKEIFHFRYNYQK